MIDPKQIKKLAAACRRAGIKEFTSPEFSFKLDELPAPRTRSSKVTGPMAKDPEVDAPSLTEEQMLFWSSPDLSESSETQ